jgi:glycosyltransferase involved in cell wall biosynthesis
MPLVSIITPCYNSRAFIERTIASVRAQTLRDWEHIVVDDGSTDGSADEVERLCGESALSESVGQRLRLIRQVNGGVCNARNNGFAASSPRSKYVLFLDADDCLEPEMLEALTSYLEANPGVGAAYCAHAVVDEADTPRPGPPPPPDRFVPSFLGVRCLADSQPETPFVSLFACAMVLPSTCVLRREVYERTQGWDEVYGQHGEERDLMLRVVLQSPVHFVARPMVRYRRYPTQSSVKHGTWRMPQQIEKFYRKWRSLPSLSDQQKKQCFQSWRFVEGRVNPYFRIQAAKQALRQGNLRFFIRHCAWAARRFLQVSIARDWP